MMGPDPTLTHKLHNGASAGNATGPWHVSLVAITGVTFHGPVALSAVNADLGRCKMILGPE